MTERPDAAVLSDRIDGATVVFFGDEGQRRVGYLAGDRPRDPRTTHRRRVRRRPSLFERRSVSISSSDRPEPIATLFEARQQRAAAGEQDAALDDV